MILFYDTETTGFTRKGAPLEQQPHIVQLAAMLCEPTGRVVSSINFIVDPGVEKGVRIPEEAARIHGIDEETAWRHGVSTRYALMHFNLMLLRADIEACHNLAYDEEIVRIACERVGIINHRAPEKYCTMLESVPICKIPSPRGGFKWPKLEEAVQHFFGEKLEGAHDAMVDVNACKRVYFKLMEGKAS